MPKFRVPTVCTWEGEFEVEALNELEAAAIARIVIMEEDPSYDGWDGDWSTRIHPNEIYESESAPDAGGGEE